MGEGISGYDSDIFPKVVMSHLGMMDYAFCAFLLSMVELFVYKISVMNSSSPVKWSIHLISFQLLFLNQYVLYVESQVFLFSSTILEAFRVLNMNLI